MTADPSPEPTPVAAPVAAQFCATFLKPEMFHLYRQIAGLKAFRPVVITRSREAADRFPFAPVEVLRRPWWRGFDRFWRRTLWGRPLRLSRREVTAILDLLERYQARLLHIYFGHIGVLALPLLERCPIPVAVSFHGADAGVEVGRAPYRAALAEVFRRADRVLVRSRALEENLLELGCPPAKIRLQRAGIPLAEFPPQRRAAPADGRWTCLQVSRLIPKKGLVTTLKAFARFAKEFPAARLIVAGEGPLLAGLRRLAGELGIGAQVEFAGFVRGDDLRRLYYAAHIFLHPSETAADGNREGVPNALLEAMATGLPAVATRHGGIPEAVADGRTGALVAEGDDLAVTAVLRAWAGDYAAAAATGEAGAAAVAANFDLAAQLRVLEGHYRELLVGVGGPAPVAGGAG